MVVVVGEAGKRVMWRGLSCLFGKGFVRRRFEWVGDGREAQGMGSVDLHVCR